MHQSNNQGVRIMAEKADGNLLPMIDQYREAIIIMMRHGTNVDHIAKKLQLSEIKLAAYIKKESLDKQLARRSWTWNSNHKCQRKPSRKSRNQNKKEVYPIYHPFSKIC